MTKHAKKTEPLQLVDRRKTATVRIPVPFLDVLASIEHSFFDGEPYGTCLPGS